MTDGRECLRRRYLLRQSVPDMGSCNRERLTDGTIRRLVPPERNVMSVGRADQQQEQLDCGPTPSHRGALSCKTVKLYTSAIDSLGDAHPVKAGKSVGGVVRWCCRVQYRLQTMHS